MATGTSLIILSVFLTIAAIVLVIAMFARRYVKVPPDKVLVVYGRRARLQYRDASGAMRDRVVGYRLIQGGGSFIVPVLEKFGWLALNTHTVETEVPEVFTKLGVALSVEAVAQVKIKSDEVSIATAAEQLLDKPDSEIIEIAKKTLEGHIRGVCAQLTVEEINADRNALSQKIQEEAVPDFEKLGLQITVFVIKDIKDKVGYLDSLGKKRTAEVQRDAEIGRANAERDRMIQVANAKKEAESAQAASLERDRLIAVTQSQRDGAVERTKREAEIASAEKERDVLKARYMTEVKQQEAERDLAYEIQQTKKKAELTRAAMEVEIERKRKEVELKEQEIAMQEKAQHAEQVIPAQRRADALAFQADGEKRRTIANAEAERENLRLTGEGEAARVRAIAEAEAYRIKITGEAEASAALARGQAEAKAMQLKAEAWKQYSESAKLQMIVEKLPEIATAMAKPLENTQKIVLMGGNGTNGLVQATAQSIATLPVVVESLTGTSLRDLIADTASALKGEKRTVKAEEPPKRDPQK